MNPDAPIVVGTDGSACAEPAVEWAADEARLHGRPLRIVHSVEYPGPRLSYDSVAHSESHAAGQSIADPAPAAALLRHPGLSAEADVVVGDAAQSLIAASEQAAMIVVGNRGHGGFHDLVLGSTGIQTAMHARCPVAVVRPGRPATAFDGYADRRVVVGVDGSPKSAVAVELAFAEAARRGVGVTALHAWERPLASGFGDAPIVYDTDALSAVERNLLAEYLARPRDAYPEVDVEELVVEAPAAAALIDASDGAALVVAGSRGHGGFMGLLLGSVSHALVHHARCPVLIARAE